MSTAELVARRAAAIARWLDRSESALLLEVDASGALVHGNRAFLARSGLAGGTGIALADLLADPSGQALALTGSPPVGALVTRILAARGDDTPWLCAVFDIDGGRLLAGTKLESSIEDWMRTETRLVADLTALQRELVVTNRELEQARAQLSELLHTDVLTGVGTRRALDERLSAELAKARRHQLPLSVVVCDIDRFKRVNDEHGHAAGDAVLRAFGAILRGGTRGSDFPARPGGEEFTVLLPMTDLAGACALAERLRVATEQTVVPEIGRAVTASFGVARWQPDESVAAWLERADQALYRAKEGGRNRVEPAAPG